MTQSKRTVLLVCAIALGVGLAVASVILIRCYAARSTKWLVILNDIAPYLVSTESIAENLERDSGEPLYSSLSILRQRRYVGAQARARQLLRSTDPYAWLSAAHYLAGFKDKESVPYLIRALRHTAWRSDEERARDLRTLTGQDFGTDFKRWKQWWEGMNPHSEFDWESALGDRPRIKKE